MNNKMKILSIDVGIKNLAFCLFEKLENNQLFIIKKWDIINISESEILSCSFIDKNIICNKPAKFKKNDKCYCLKHSKKQTFQIPTTEQMPSFINKQKIQKLYEIADKHNIKYNNKIKKTDLIDLINETIQNNYFQKVECKNASEIDLFDIGVNIKNKFNVLFENEEKIDYVIIENQISPIATRMKTIQGMIMQYFIMSNITVDYIKFISASNKLKMFYTPLNGEKIEKTKYSDRKKLSIQKTLEILIQHSNYQNWETFFNQHLKKDDLADSFLQGLWFINNHNNF
jgi:hypothetical protein